MTNGERLVVKVGSGLLRDPGGGLRDEVVRHIVRQIVSLRDEGREVILVSSGAIALGIQVLGQASIPKAITHQQAAAAIGQGHLIRIYEDIFASFGKKAAQVLLTHDDLRVRRRYLNARNTLLVLLQYGVVPVINENDTVSVDEIRFGDNDVLAAMVCNLVDADRLIILTSVDGLYTADPSLHPEAKIISRVEDARHRQGRHGHQDPRRQDGWRHRRSYPHRQWV